MSSSKCLQKSFQAFASSLLQNESPFFFSFLPSFLPSFNTYHPKELELGPCRNAHDYCLLFDSSTNLMASNIAALSLKEVGSSLACSEESSKASAFILLYYKTMRMLVDTHTFYSFFLVFCSKVLAQNCCHMR
jgi:hypothetical protein